MIASWLIDQLVQQGVKAFCIAPGSRSTPLVQAVLRHPKATAYVHFDERGLGFFALGIALASQKPVVTIVTSGTAVGNLLPSIMEAHHSHIPLIFLTADRPAELRDCGANQTTDQIKIFQPFIRYQTDLPIDGAEKTIRSIGAQAAFAASSPGPVHINCPLREPLYQKDLKIEQGKPVPFILPRLTIDGYATKMTKGVILAGKLPRREDIHAVLDLAKRLQWPLLADILSNARCYPTNEQIRFFDWIEKPDPEFILHLGERMTSKNVLDWIKKINPEYVHVSPRPQLIDPERLVTSRIQADISPFCEVFNAPQNALWISKWKDEEPLFEERGAFTEVHAMKKIAKHLPPDMGVFLGNGMPIRDADHFFFPRKCGDFFSNRGLSGIDGNIATIAGLAQVMPILAFIGDQAALYDLNSLPLLKKTRHRVVLIISNNFGGGIFHHLPVSKEPQFENYWALAHSHRFEKVASMFDIPYASFDNIEKVLNQTAIVELITDRRENHLYQKKVNRGPLNLLCKNSGLYPLHSKSDHSKNGY